MDLRLAPEQEALGAAAAHFTGGLGVTAVGQLDHAERTAELDAAMTASGWREVRADDGGRPLASGSNPPWWPSSWRSAWPTPRPPGRCWPPSSGAWPVCRRLPDPRPSWSTARCARSSAPRSAPPRRGWPSMPPAPPRAAQSVVGGASQIQRNLIATRLLGLPT